MFGRRETEHNAITITSFVIVANSAPDSPPPRAIWMIIDVGIIPGDARAEREFIFQLHDFARVESSL
jgi:hypothetical protein